MTIDATFWVGVSFILFFAGLIYLKIPQKVMLPPKKLHYY